MSLFDRITATSLFDRVTAVLEAEPESPGAPQDPTKPFKYKGKNWDEKKHPRGKGGKFQKKSVTAEPASATPTAEVPAVAPELEPVPAAVAPVEPPAPAPPAPEPPPPLPPPAPEPVQAAPAPAVDPAVAAMQAKVGSKFPPSKYQMAVFNWIEAATKKDKAAVVIDAKAGAGKTTTIEQALKLIPKEQKVVFVAFNKHIADELARRTEGDDQVLASTLSSLGWAACRKAFPYTNEDIIKYYKGRGLPIPSMKDRYGKGPILDDNKVPNIIKRLVTDKQDLERWASSMNDLIRLKKQYYSTDEAGKFNGPSGESIAAKHGIEVPAGDEGKRYLATAAAVWKESLADTYTMDFADQVFFPAMKKLPLADKRYGLKTLDADWVMVDESQDLSMTESTLIKRVAPRTVVVGDPNQSIYLFKGSDPTSMSKLRATLGADELPLSISYRCSKAVIAEAQKIVPSIEPAPGAKEGSIQTIEWNAIAENAKPGDQVLCRTNAPLVSECLKLISQGKKAHIKGRDIGKSVEKTIKQIGGGKKYNPDEPIADFYKKVYDFKESEKARLMAADKEHLIAGLEDKVETILALGQGLNKVGQIIERINQIFTADKSPGVTFSTVHKAKGLEAEHVFIMRPDLLPFPNAKSPEEMQQEMNLKYVAITRSKDKLTWVKPPPKQPAEGGMGESEGRGLFARVLAEAKLTGQQAATLSNLTQWFAMQPFLYYQSAGTWWAQARDKKGKPLRVHPQVMDSLVKRGYVTRLTTPWENLQPHEKGYRRDLLLQVTRTA